MLISMSSPPPWQRGFTMVELVVAIAIAGVALSLGAPAFRDAVQNARIRTASESILSGLQTARAEAVRRNADVQFEFLAAPATDWSVKLRSSALQTSSGEAATGITANTNNKATAVTFDGLGRVRPTDFLGSPPFSQVDIDSKVLPSGASRELRIIVNSGGEIRMCDPGVDPPDPRTCK